MLLRTAYYLLFGGEGYLGQYGCIKFCAKRKGNQFFTLNSNEGYTFLCKNLSHQ